MKVNIISDIHAIYDPKQDCVMYHLPFKYAKKKYLDAANCLYDFWANNLEMLKQHKFTKHPFLDSYPECNVVKNHDDALTILKEFRDACEYDFCEVSVDKMFHFARALFNIDDFIANYGIIWNKSKSDKLTTKLSIRYDLCNFMYKCLGDFEPSKLEPADYLIIAGDLGLDNTYDKVLADITKQTDGKFKKILHIAGNHDHWWHGDQSNGMTRPDTVNLSHDYCEYQDGGYLFLGCTLWTPISDNAVWSVGRYMNDYRYIPGKFTPYASRHQYELQSKWLKDKIEQNKDKKIIVFTHHQPFEELTAEDYKHNGKSFDGIDVNSAYVVLDHSLDDINKYGNIKLWCCGHTHQNFDGILHNVHVVRNPIGYGDFYSRCPAENLSGTWYNKIVEV